jgi:hypothetical protein
MSLAEAKEEFDRTIGNAISSYRYFIRTLPPEGLFASCSSVTLNGREFERYEQALAMLRELGSVFFCRMEASLEALINRLGLQGEQFLQKVRDSGEFSADDLEALRTARELRNIFHHGAGDWTLLKNEPKLVRTSPQKEPVLYPDHIERFYSLFTRVGTCLSRP